jgi:hypothetical protein
MREHRAAVQYVRAARTRINGDEHALRSPIPTVDEVRVAVSFERARIELMRR